MVILFSLYKLNQIKMDTVIRDQKLEDAALKHAHLKPGFDQEDEEYYNSTGMNAYKSFIAGVNYRENNPVIDPKAEELFWSVAQNILENPDKSMGTKIAYLKTKFNLIKR